MLHVGDVLLRTVEKKPTTSGSLNKPYLLLDFRMNYLLGLGTNQAFFSNFLSSPGDEGIAIEQRGNRSDFKKVT